MKLKSLIYGKGLSQWDVAKQLKWSESKLSRFITGRQLPSNEDLLRLSRVLKVPENELRKIFKHPQFDEVDA